MKFLSFASEVSELEEAINEIGQKYNEMYFYVKFTFFILVGIVLIKLIKLILNAIDKEAIEYSKRHHKQSTDKEIKNKTDINQ